MHTTPIFAAWGDGYGGEGTSQERDEEMSARPSGPVTSAHLGVVRELVSLNNEVTLLPCQELGALLIKKASLAAHCRRELAATD